MSVNIYDDTQGTLTRVDGVADIAFKTDLIELTSVALNSVGYSIISNAIPSVQGYETFDVRVYDWASSGSTIAVYNAFFKNEAIIITGTPSKTVPTIWIIVTYIKSGLVKDISLQS